MIRTAKGPEPDALREARATPNATWDTVRSADLHEGLLRDQGHLCAYCQRRIHARATAPRDQHLMHVEHWRPRSTHKEHELAWRNLLGVCPGVTGTERHCDTSRANASLFLHPVEGEGQSPLDHLDYRDNGVVAPLPDSPNREPLESDIRALNLRATHLIRARGVVIEQLKQKLDKGNWGAAAFKKLLAIHEHRPGARRPEHAEVVCCVLRRWARKRRIEIP